MTSWITEEYLDLLLTPAWVEKKLEVSIGNGSAARFAAELRIPSAASELAALVGKFDTVLVAVCSPEMEEFKEGTEFSSYSSTLKLALDGQTVDSRVVTSANRRHQFLIPVSDLLASTTLTVGNEEHQAAALSPCFRFRLWALNAAELYQGLEERMIWIFGAARSGTTWLLHDLLGKVPSSRIATDDTGSRPIDEPNIGQILGAINPNPEPLYWMSSGKVMTEASYQKDANGKVFLVDPLFQRIYDRIVGKKESIFEEKNWQVMRDALRAVVVGTVINNWGCIGYDRVVLKCPNGIHAADILLKVLPRCRVIAIYRDPREIVRSHFGAFSSRVLNESSDKQLREFSLSYWAHLLVRQFAVLELALESVPQQQKLVLKYEDLRRGELSAFTSLFSFVDSRIDTATVESIMSRGRFEAMPAAATGSGKPRDVARIDAFKETFSETEITVLERVLRPCMERLGYTDFLTSPDDAAASTDSGLPVIAGMSGCTVNGIFDDGWSDGRYVLHGTADSKISECVADIYCPGRFYPDRSYRFAFRVNDRYQIFEIRNEDSFSLSLDVAIEPSEKVEIELLAGQHFLPSEFGSPDLRKLSFTVKVAVR